MNEEHNHSMSSRSVIDVAEELEGLQEEQKTDRFCQLQVRQQQAVFQRLRPTHQSELLRNLDRPTRGRLFVSLEFDDQVRLIERQSPQTVEELREELSAEDMAVIDQLLQYPEESAGRILNPYFLDLSPDMTAEVALTAIQRRRHEVESVLVLPVTERDGRLVGLTMLDEITFAPADTKVCELMQVDPPWVLANEDQELVGKLMQTADVLAIPVVDKEHRLLGMVTIDDVMDIMEIEHYEDLAHTGATEPLKKPYLSLSVFRLMRSRIIWLFLLTGALTLTVNVLNLFKGTLEEIVNLSLFIPLLIGVGGNAGAQSATTIVRALAVEDVRGRDVARVAFRESIVGLLLGTSLGAIGVLVVWIFFGQALAMVVALALVVICTIASLVGSVMPLLANRLGIDPAVVSAPFVTTVVDTTGLVIYFLIARAVFSL